MGHYHIIQYLPAVICLNRCPVRRHVIYIYLMLSFRGSLNEVKSKETEYCIQAETVMSVVRSYSSRVYEEVFILEALVIKRVKEVNP